MSQTNEYHGESTFEASASKGMHLVNSRNRNKAKMIICLVSIRDLRWIKETVRPDDIGHSRGLILSMIGSRWSISVNIF